MTGLDAATLHQIAQAWALNPNPSGITFERQDPREGAPPGEEEFIARDANGNVLVHFWGSQTGNDYRFNQVRIPQGSTPITARPVLRQFLANNPSIQTLSGERVSGARGTGTRGPEVSMPVRAPSFTGDPWSGSDVLADPEKKKLTE